MKMSLMVIDDFYDNADEVRKFALTQPFTILGNYPGQRTQPFLTTALKNVLQQIVLPWGGEVTNWPDQYCGAFQICNRADRTWIHADSYSNWAGVLYLTPNPPLSSGTSFYRHKVTGKDIQEGHEPNQDGQDYTLWDRTDYIANKYNRLILYRAKLYHASADYFGYDNESGRLFQTFFFTTEQ